tara:strand:+ start:1286 stop:1543 length:258 start_codon:yes stop_codon:yes gene_type:complete
MNYLLFKIINGAFDLIQLALLVRVGLSWFNHNPYSSWIRFLNQLTEPILKPIRENLPFASMGVDFSPMVAFFLLGIIRKLLLSVI